MDLAWPETVSVVALLLVILGAGVKEVWIFGPIHRRIVAGKDAQLAACDRERDEWKRLALAQAGILEETIERTTRLVVQAKESGP